MDKTKSDKFSPEEIDKVKVIGRVVGVIRRF